MSAEYDVPEKVAALLDALDNVRRNGSGFVASCPGHEDRDPSLSIGWNERTIALWCFAGCDTEAILEAKGWTWADLFFDDKPPTMKPRRRSWRAMELEAQACAIRLQSEQEVLNRLRFGRVIGHHEDVFDGERRPMEIRDGRGWSAQALEALGVGWDGSRLTLPVRSADGKLHDILRYDPWSTRRKVLAGKGKSRLPWPAPEWVEAETLFLVEGEGTAISMASVGYRAVGLPGSISKPRTSITHPGRWEGTGWHRAWAQRFTKFKRIVLLPDCDLQGRALMRAASYDLDKLGVENHILDLGPGGEVENLRGEKVRVAPLNDGSDIADHLLKTAWDRESRKVAHRVIREMVAAEVGVLA